MDLSNYIPPLPFCSHQTLSKKYLQLVGKFGDDCGLYHISKAADQDAFEESLHFYKKEKWFKKMTPMFFEKDVDVLLTTK